MSSTLKNILLLMTAVLALGGGYWLAQLLHPPESAPVTTPSYGGGQMIDFSLFDDEGKKRSLSDWRGKVIVLNFWATWCAPCREEIPLLVSLQKQYAANNLQIIGLAIDTLPAVKVYRKSMGMNYPNLIGDDESLQLIADYGNRLGSLPYTVIIDSAGAIVVRKLGPFKHPDLEALLKPLLALNNNPPPE